MTGVTAVMVAHNNEERSLTRLTRDLLPALHALDCPTEIIVVDNSRRRSWRLAELIAHCGIDHHYLWQAGRNLFYGPAINRAVTLARHPRLLYVCSNHGHAYDVTWPVELLAAVDYAQVAMAGTLAPAGPPQDAGFPGHLEPIHVQGGVFAARTDVLRRHPYPDGEYAQWGSDIVMSFALQLAGYTLVDVPTIRSVWRSGPGDGQWKYVHSDD